MKSRILLASLLTGAIVAVTTQTAVAATCKDVKFNVVNEHFEGRKIQIRKVKFRNPHKNGKVQTEDVRNKVCQHGDTCSTGGDNLKDADKVDLYDIQVEFRYWEHDDQWSKTFITQPFTPKYRKCKDGKQYGPIVVKDSG